MVPTGQFDHSRSSANGTGKGANWSDQLTKASGWHRSHVSLLHPAKLPDVTWLAASHQANDAADSASVMETGDLSPVLSNLSPAWANLLPLDGNDQVDGEPIALRGQVVRVGRGQDNDLVVSDSTVSRYHVKLYAPDNTGALVVEDLGSNNGTFLNQVRLSQPTIVQHNDELKIGQVPYRVHIIAPEQHQRDSGLAKLLQERSQLSYGVARAQNIVTLLVKGLANLSRQAILLGLLGLGLVIGLLVVRHAYFSDQQQQLAFAEYLQVLSAVRKGDLAGASAMLKQEIPFQKKHTLSIQAQQQLADIEKQQAQLELAQKALEQLDYDKARTIAQSLLDGYFFNEAQAIESKVEAWIELSLGNLSNLMQKEQWVAAKELASQLAPFCHGRADFAELQIASEMGLLRVKQREQLVVSNVSQWSAGTKRLVQAIAGMRRDEIERSLLAISERDGPEATVEQATDTANWLLAAIEARKAKRHVAALRLFEQVSLHLEQLGIGGASPLSQWLQRSRADMLYLNGMEALDHERWSEAFRAFQTVLERNPQHVLVKQQLEGLRQRAANLASAANASERIDKAEARRLWQSVLELLTPQDPLYRRASSHLKALD